MNTQIDEVELERIYQLAMDTRRTAHHHKEESMDNTPHSIQQPVPTDVHPFETQLLLDKAMNEAEPVPVLQWPHKKLETRCDAIEEIDVETLELIATLVKTMHANRGVGLAANQIGVMKRVIVIDLADRMEAPMALVNPRIVQRYGDVTMLKEKCLSAKGVEMKTQRHLKVRITALDITGEPLEFEAENEMAACLQHEIDHLDGVMFFDRATSQAAADIAKRKAKKKAKIAGRRAKKKKG